MTIRRVLLLCVAAAVLASASPAVMAQQAAQQGTQGRRSEQQQADVNALVQLVDQVNTADPAGSPDDQRQGEVEVTWNSNHFIRGQDGSTYVPFTVTVDRADLTTPNAALYIRAVSKSAPAAAPAAAPAENNRDNDQPAARPMYAWETVAFPTIREDGQLQRAMQLPGGEYDIFIAVKDVTTNQRNQPMAKAGLLRKRLVVPDYKAADLKTSSIMVGTIEPLAQPLPADQQPENPYVFGTMRIVPLTAPQLSKSGELSLLFWIYGVQVDAATRKPNVTVEYNFYVTEPGAVERYFNKTAPQDLNAQTLPPDFDLAAGHQLPGSLGVPLASFPVGNYRLEVKVTDKVSGKTLTENVNFAVAA
jgi:hypothetical protein